MINPTFQCKDEQLLTPLHLACTYGQISVARILLENGADITSSGEKKQTALHKAAAVGNATLVEMVTFAARQIYGRAEVVRVSTKSGNRLYSLHFQTIHPMINNVKDIIYLC